MFMVPTDFTSPNSQNILISALLAVELMIADLHSFWLLKGCSASFSFVSHCLSVNVLVLGAELAFMRASILARWSGESLPSNSDGIGICPVVVEVVVLSCFIHPI